jgi:cytochrome c-type biogenesis protein CcmH/NrfG
LPPDRERELRTLVEKDLAHIENLFGVARAAFRSNDLTAAANYLAAVGDEIARIKPRVAQLQEGAQQ